MARGSFLRWWVRVIYGKIGDNSRLKYQILGIKDNIDTYMRIRIVNSVIVDEVGVPFN